MVITSLRGGLGNQMFQYAAGLNLALQNKTSLILDTTFLNDRFPRREFTYRKFDLDVFNLTTPAKFTALSKISETMPVPGLWLGIDVAMIEIGSMVGARTIIKEDGKSIDSKYFQSQKDLFLWGRWQSQDYFSENQEAVRHAFHFKFPLEGAAVDLAQAIKNSNSVALHVRRGDYVVFKNMKQLAGDTNIAYYEKAIAYIADHVKNPIFFIFSDDIAWCRENIKPPFPTTYVMDDSRGPKASFHLELMSLCKHAIIANSTFSWWGAWLNSNPEKIVVAPQRWQVQDVSSGNRTPQAWIKI